MLANAAALGQCGGDGVAGGVVVPMALRHGPLHHRPDTLAHPAHGLGLGVPVRDEHRHHVRGGDFVDALATQPRHGVVPEARSPLRLALSAVLPALAVDADHDLGRLGEGWHVGPAPQRDRVTAGSGSLAILEGGLPGFGQGDVGEAAEADITSVSVHGSAPDPLLGDRLSFSGLVDSEPEAVLIAIDARSVDGSDKGGVEASRSGGIRGGRSVRCHGYSTHVASHTCFNNGRERLGTQGPSALHIQLYFSHLWNVMECTGTPCNGRSLRSLGFAPSAAAVRAVRA